MQSICRLKLATLTIALGLFFQQAANADAILFGFVGASPYHSQGEALAGYASSGGTHTVTQFNLYDAPLGDLSGYDQIWVYDLQTGSNDSATLVANYTAIANWFDSSSHDLIVDGRIISSHWTNTSGGQEAGWIANYADQLAARSGGLVLGTDHNDYHGGINLINAQIGIDPFTGFDNGPRATIDTASPLYKAVGGGTHACAAGQCIWDDSSTGYVPTGQQTDPNIFLTPVAYHGSISANDFDDAYDKAAVASTFGSRTFGTCGGAGQPACEGDDVPEPGPLGLLGLGLVLLSVQRWKSRKS